MKHKMGTKSEVAEPEFYAEAFWKFAGIYLLFIQPVLLFLIPLIRYDEYRLGVEEPLFGLGASAGAWRNVLISVYGIWAGTMLWQNHPNAARTAQRSIVISVVSALAFLIVSFLVPFHSVFRKAIRIDQSAAFLQAFGTFVIWLLYFKPWKFSESSSLLFNRLPAWGNHQVVAGSVAAVIGLALVTEAFATRPMDIFEAAWNGDLKEVEKFVKSGVDVNARAWNENSPLHLARTKELAEYLLSVRCPVDIRNSSRETPLHLAAFDGRAEVCMVLIEHGAEVNTTNVHGLTPLDHALFGKGRKWRGDYDTIVTLLAGHGGKTGAEVESDLQMERSKVALNAPLWPGWREFLAMQRNLVD